MMWKNICFLHTESTALDEYCRPYTTFTRRKIMCNKKSVRQSEFYQAQAQGFKPELVIEVRQSEYNGENHLDYSGKTYRIIRTYERTDEICELTCISWVNENAGTN